MPTLSKKCERSGAGVVIRSFCRTVRTMEILDEDEVADRQVRAAGDRRS